MNGVENSLGLQFFGRRIRNLGGRTSELMLMVRSWREAINTWSLYVHLIGFFSSRFRKQVDSDPLCHAFASCRDDLTLLDDCPLTVLTRWIIRPYAETGCPYSELVIMPTKSGFKILLKHLEIEVVHLDNSQGQHLSKPGKVFITALTLFQVSFFHTDSPCACSWLVFVNDA